MVRDLFLDYFIMAKTTITIEANNYTESIENFNKKAIITNLTSNMKNSWIKLDSNYGSWFILQGN